MCWNADVSLNTFLFSGFVLALIIYNNSFTKYKIQELNNIWTYLFIASFATMQLIEFFIWKTMKVPFYNKLFNILANLLIIVQPIVSIMILSNTQLRNIVLTSYLLLAVPFSIYKLFTTTDIHTKVSACGHLRWNLLTTSKITQFIWLAFFLFSLFYERKLGLFIFGVIMLITTYMNYLKDHSVSTMWCWSANSVMVFYAIYLLFYLPFLDMDNTIRC
jgi:hypothetical protein